jgi:DNA invertase Pin-like site-specific DNA recombinase
MRIGYARVSAGHQNLDRQLAMLKAAGCKRVFKEKQSGRHGVRRPELEKAIEALGPSDVLILAEWDRATRSMLDGIRIIERVAARGASLKALDRQWLDLTTPVGKGILAFLSALAEDERARILARANGGRAAARKRGVKFGPKPKLAAHQQREAVRMVREGHSRAVKRSVFGAGEGGASLGVRRTQRGQEPSERDVPDRAVGAGFRGRRIVGSNGGARRQGRCRA